MKHSIVSPYVLLRVEGLAIFVLAVATYFVLRESAWLFVALLLAPDLAMLGYMAGPKVGAATYNVAHLMAIPVMLLIAGAAFSAPLVTAIALIWAAHIGMDRTVGYGLKYSTAFKDTHLNRV